MSATLEKCHACHGTGKTKLTVVTHPSSGPSTENTCEITCIHCDGSGEETGKVFLEEIIQWCDCGKDWTFYSYPEDGECSCGVYKHHVHCGTCGRISQIG